MNNTGLERRITCARADRVADLRIVESILRKVADLPLKDCFEGEPELHGYVLAQLGMKRDMEGVCVTPEDIEEHEEVFNSMTYGKACRKLICDYEKGYDIKDQLVMAMAFGFREGETVGEGMRTFALLNRVGLEEYFKALSRITGRDEDGRLPDEVVSCGDQSIRGILYRQCYTFHDILDRICCLLIKPFSEIEYALCRERGEYGYYDGEEVPWVEYEETED